MTAAVAAPPVIPWEEFDAACASYTGPAIGPDDFVIEEDHERGLYIIHSKPVSPVISPVQTHVPMKLLGREEAIKHAIDAFKLIYVKKTRRAHL